jgi:TolB-like protein
MVFLILFSLMGCASAPKSNNIAIKGTYFTGEAGKDIRIAILRPKGIKIPEGQNWFLSLIQSSITSDYNRFSNMTVIDRQHLDEILKEQNLSMKGEFSDKDYIRIGNLTNAQYILTGNLTKTTGVSFLLDLAVTNPETGVRLASFGPKEYSITDIQSMYATKDGTFELLSQMGVDFTENGKKPYMQYHK